MINFKKKYENVCKMNKIYKFIFGLIVVLFLFGIVSATTVINSNSITVSSILSNINMTNHNITGLLNLESTNITSKQIGGVIYADEYGSIQAALDARTNNETIYVPNGIYLIDSQINILSNTTIIGENRELTIFKHTTAAGAIINQLPLTIDNVEISNICFDVNHTSNLLAVNLGGDNIKINNCIFKNGIDYKLVKIGYLYDLLTSDDSNKSNNIEFVGNLIKDSTLSTSEAVFIMNADNVEIKNNEFNNLSGYTSLALYGQSDFGIIKDNYFVNNTVTRTIWLIGTDGIKVTGNTFLGTQKGTEGISIDMNNNINTNIHNNIFKYNTVNGIKIQIIDYDSVTPEFDYYTNKYSTTHNIQIHHNIMSMGWHSLSMAAYQHADQNQYNIFFTDNKIFGNNTPASGGVLIISNSSYTTELKNIEISRNIWNGTTPGACCGIIHIEANGTTKSHNFTIENNDFETTERTVSNGWAISFKNVTNSRIQYNRIGNIPNGMLHNQNSSNIILYQNYGENPFSFGISTSTPTPFGAGDEYYNTTDNIKYCYNGSTWHALW